jgi:hypothetical protein
MFQFTLDELDELAGNVAAEANRATNKVLQEQLDQICERIEGCLDQGIPMAMPEPQALPSVRGTSAGSKFAQTWPKPYARRPCGRRHLVNRSLLNVLAALSCWYQIPVYICQAYRN